MRNGIIKRATVVFLIAGGALFAAGQNAKPGARYQEWLSGPASYLLTKPEREAFQTLKSDQERDRFIDNFWEIRNPAQGTGANEFKEEFYRRLGWANAHFGEMPGTDGWRTDMGKTYILFGKPKTTMNWSSNQELRPIELWFYANPGLSELPPFFYVMFFERDDISGYRFYNPLVDGPDKLMRDENYSKAQAYRYLSGISAELAHCSLTLIPGEPIDTDGFSGSMESVSIMNAIQGYRDMPSYVGLVAARTARQERVTTRVAYDVPKTKLVTMVEGGEWWLSWQMEVDDPLQAKAAGGQVAFDMDARLYSGGRLVYERTDKPSFKIPSGEEEALKKRPFAYEDRMPVVGGEYRLAVSATNRANGKQYQVERNVTVAPDQPVALSDIVVVAGGEQDDRPRPFRFGGMKFFPASEGQVHASAGLRVLYQVLAAGERPESLEVEYVIGGFAKFRKSYVDRIDMSRADEAGALTTVKTLPIEDLSPGAYQLALRIKDPRSGRIWAQATGFTVAAGPEPAPVVISRGGTDAPQWMAVSQYERALCWLALNRPREAVASLEASWKLNQNPVTRALLQRLHETTGQDKARN